VVFDKTGTITHSQSMKAEWVGEELTTDEQIFIRSLARNSTHPASITIADSMDCEVCYDVEGFREVPSLGISGTVRGHRVLIGSHRFITGKDKPETGATTEVYVSINSRSRGFFRIENHYREGLDTVIRNLQHFNLHLLTGDNDSEKSNLLRYFKDETPLHFHQTPEDKLNYVQQLQSSGSKVLMIGDGLNDAGALLKSDVGITIADDIYHFSPACDAILQSGEFSRLHGFLRFTRSSLVIVYSSYALSFLYNVVGLSFAVQGMLSPIVAAILMPISSVSIVAFTTFSVSLMARKKGF